MAVERRKSAAAGFLPNPGPFLAKIVSHLDSRYMGSLEVELLSKVGSDEDASGQVFQVKYLNPFYGVTSPEFLANSNEYNDTQKSYGMWFVPPDIGVIVMVIFVDGDPTKGYWIGCVQDEFMNFMIPGIAATEANEEPGRSPTAEFNKQANDIAISDPDQLYKPIHPLRAVFDQQGLLEDDARGITTSSARREWPSAVFGISTPGPVDKQPNSKQGNIGKAESQVIGAYVSRLGGTTFVMDDGDDKFLRKVPASEGPPEYAAVEQNETDGDVTIPHNELVRIRTRTGHQILLHNSEDLIYIGNSKGTTWIELTSDGKIDIYAKDSISIHTDNDLNIRADRDINFESGRNINMKSNKNMQIETVSKYDLLIGKGGRITTVENSLDINTKVDNNFTAGKNTNIKSAGQHLETAKQIHMNGPTATTASNISNAEKLKIFDNLTNDPAATLKSILLRVPTPEPWPCHENLDPTSFKTSKTDITTGTPLKEAPKFWKEYTTKTDTFFKVKGAEE